MGVLLRLGWEGGLRFGAGKCDGNPSWHRSRTLRVEAKSRPSCCRTKKAAAAEERRPQLRSRDSCLCRWHQAPRTCLDASRRRPQSLWHCAPLERFPAIQPKLRWSRLPGLAPGSRARVTSHHYYRCLWHWTPKTRCPRERVLCSSESSSAVANRSQRPGRLNLCTCCQAWKSRWSEPSGLTEKEQCHSARRCSLPRTASLGLCARKTTCSKSGKTMCERSGAIFANRRWTASCSTPVALQPGATDC